MFSLHLALIFIYSFVFFPIVKSDNEDLIVPCFNQNINVEISQFDDRVSMKFINCTRHLTKHIFTIKFEIDRHLSKIDYMLNSHMVVTLFAGPCSSSTATLNIGRTFPSTHGSLDGSHPSPVASSHLPRNGQAQKGTISYEYGGAGGEFAQLVSALIHVVIRYGREEMIKGVYVIKFHH